jgi:hypothetical protein
MNESVKIRGWLGHLERQIVEGTDRWLTAYESMAAGTYEPKQAFADWSYFLAAGWLSVLPDAPAAAKAGVPLVLLTVHLGQATAAGMRSIPPAAGTVTASDLKLEVGGGKLVVAAQLTCELFDGRTTLLVKASGLDTLAPALVTGERYKGDVSVAGAKIADLALVVLGAL